MKKLYEGKNVELSWHWPMHEVRPRFRYVNKKYAVGESHYFYLLWLTVKWK